MKENKKEVIFTCERCQVEVPFHQTHEFNGRKLCQQCYDRYIPAVNVVVFCCARSTSDMHRMIMRKNIHCVMTAWIRSSAAT